MAHHKELSASHIRYLLTMKQLEQNGSRLRCVDVAAALGLSRPSVHNMMDTLTQMGLIGRNGSGTAYFTPEGRGRAVCRLLPGGRDHTAADLPGTGGGPERRLQPDRRDSGAAAVGTVGPDRQKTEKAELDVRVLLFYTGYHGAVEKFFEISGDLWYDKIILKNTRRKLSCAITKC